MTLKVYWAMMSGQQNTAQILTTAACSSDAAEEFAARYRQAYPKLTIIAAGILGQREGAEDIVQQAACIALEKRASHDSTGHFVGWLAGIVRHCALNHRKKTRNRKTFPADPSHFSQIADEAAASSDVLPVQPKTGIIQPDQHSFDDEVLHALYGLGTDARCCLLLRSVQQLSYAEISDLLQIPEGTAMSHVHRSKQTLRKQLKSHENATNTQTPPQK